MRTSWILILCVVVLVGVSCDPKTTYVSPQTQLGLDTVAIDNYLFENGITAQTHPSGLRYVIVEPGAGDRPGPDKCIRINYKLWFFKETTVFEEGTNQANALSENILGLRIGLKEIQKGGKINLYVPSALAYGPTGRRDPSGKVVIPKNQILVFEVELVNVTGLNAAGGYCYPWPQ
jgi:FKBP-type peptidyl-prolyl cis-trans isomerase FkpA